MLRARLSFANVMSLVAVFIALGGSSYAAVTLKRNSVKAKHIAPSAVTSSKVADGGLLARDFATSELPRGDAGPAGPRGEAGPQGPKGEAGSNGATNVVVRTASGTVPAEELSGESGNLLLTANCDPGERATGGSVGPTDGQNLGAQLRFQRPAPDTNGSVPTGWVANFRNQTQFAAPVTVYVVCAAP